jgi:chitin disaccharide deacetylase
MSRPLILCADDYALTPSVSRAILDLAAHGHISAFSCMTASPLWAEHGRWLEDVRGKADIGLHITLVDETPLTHMPRTAPDGKLPGIGALIRKSYLGMLDLKEIEAEIRAQLNAFETVAGFSPAHLDGHLHTHVLPGIRTIVLNIARALPSQPWLRNITDRLPAIAVRGASVAKAAFLSTLGGAFVRDGADLKDRMNDSFSGVYGFDTPDYAALFERFLALGGRRPLLMCHPGGARDDTAAHAVIRAGEYAFLKSPACAAILERQNYHIARFAETLA